MTVIVHPEVDAAVRDGRPVVALESAVITCGLPRRTLAELGVEHVLEGLDGPANLAAAQAMQRAVRRGGAIPATTAVLDGQLMIGLDDAQLARVAGSGPHGPKAASRDVSGVLEGIAGTTVSATLLACALAARPIRVMATGGIGGVHRGWTRRPDISADLTQLARSPVCVVCSGAKSILDLPATLEMLETLAIPVLGYGTDRFARFYADGAPEDGVRRVDSAAAIGAICRRHWTLGCPGGVVAARPVPAEHAIPASEVEAALAATLSDAESAGIGGAALTPFLLRGLAERTGGRTIAANLALLESNASLAAEVACSLVP